MEELLSYREYGAGSVVIIAPSGEKFGYSAESIKQVVLKDAGESPPAPLDKGGEEARLPLFEDGGVATADAEPGGSEVAKGSKGGRGSKGDKGRK